MKYLNLLRMSLVLSMTIYVACSNNTTEIEDTDTGNETENPAPEETTYDITPVLKYFTDVEGLSYKIIGEYVYINSTGIPDHKSPYFLETEWEPDKYVDNSTTGFRLNPNRIGEQDYEFRIPLHPKEAATKRATSMGPMGVSINGIPLFNQYAAGGVALTREFQSFDQYNGHPANRGIYHYHIEPKYLTEQKGTDAFLGLLLDGFPVYGPTENGVAVDGDDLDDYHGHFGPTPDFPAGIYHYHITPDAPYINGDGFFGTPGTVSN
ncbi:YHYH protein [Wenyingzhuangia sp. IMCC45574]